MWWQACTKTNGIRRKLSAREELKLDKIDVVMRCRLGTTAVEKMKWESRSRLRFWIVGDSEIRFFFFLREHHLSPTTKLRNCS